MKASIVRQIGKLLIYRKGKRRIGRTVYAPALCEDYRGAAASLLIAASASLPAEAALGHRTSTFTAVCTMLDTFFSRV
ncbi:MAG: hypothetical protein LBF80_00405 [Spirochaetaceae bacterium]|nr:hypothetical protein [Spirochaetaceae bacterium]